MNRKTLIALIIFAALLGIVYFLQTRPKKGQRQGPRPRPISTLQGSAIKQVTITAKGAEVVLVRMGKDSWKLTKPVDYPADKHAVTTLLEKLEKMEFGDVVTEMKSKQAEYEVDGKAGAHVVVSDGSKTLADFYLGKVIDNFTMFRAANQDAIYQAVGSLSFTFAREVKEWRQRNIMEFKRDEARTLEVTTAEGTIVLSRPDEKTPFKVDSSPLPIDQLDNEAVNSLLSSLSNITAADFADKISPDKSGLDKPSATLTVTLKQGEPLTILIGANQGEDYWVQKKGQAQIFVVKKYTITNLVKRPIDFREKSVLSFKSDDVTTFSLQQKKDKETTAVRLARKGTDWFAGAKKLADPSKIKTALDALSTLKAEGFARGSAQELGLDQPQWVVEIQLKDRTKHTLTVGSKEQEGFFGLMRKGLPEIFTFRKFALDRFLLDPKELSK